jgi:ADP-ribose pyrophosphatase
VTEDTPVPGTLGVRSVYVGSVLDVRIETVRYPDGTVGELEMVRHRGAAAVLPLVEPAERCDGGTAIGVVLLKQYRHAAGGVIWEVPAGKLDGGESPEICARRELREEAGVEADRLQHLTTLLTTPGFTDERIDLFVATGLSFGASSPEGHEFIEVHVLDLERALEMVDAGDIADAKTVACLLMTARRVADGSAVV